MNATPAPTSVEADDVLIARADQRLAHAYDQIARADEQLARVTEKLSELERDGGRHASAVLGRRPSPGRSALRGLIGLLLSACVIVAALAWQTSYGDAAKPIIAQWVPRFILASSMPLERPGLATQPSPSIVQVAAAGPIPPQPTATAQTAQEVASTAAPMPPELAQLLGTMAHDLAQVEQGIEQLKTRQEQMASDNIKLVDQLKANQEQMTYLIAKASEQSLQPKTSPVLPRPITTATRKPVSPAPSPKKPRVHPQAPVQLQPKDQ